jgi:hypothetical protein
MKNNNIFLRIKISILLQQHNLFRSSGMNSDSVVEMFLSSAHFNRHGKALQHLVSSVAR